MSDDDEPARNRKGRRPRRRQIADDDDDDDNEGKDTKQESKQQSAPSGGDGEGDDDAEASSPKKGGRGRGGRGGRRQIEDDDDEDGGGGGGVGGGGGSGGGGVGDGGGGDDDEDEGGNRNQGWGNSGGAKSKRDRENPKHKSAANWDDNAEGNDTIMVIPTLSSEDEEDVKGPDKDSVANAPTASTMLPRTHELDENIKSILPTATASGIDLSILTACLVPQNLILEEDEHWPFEELLQEVAIELQEEAEDKHTLISQAPGTNGHTDDPDDF